MRQKIILIGGGGHCKSCIDVIEAEGKYTIAGIIDREENLHKKVLSYEIIGTDQELPHIIKEYKNFLITIGQVKNAERRIEIYNILMRNNANVPSIISPFAYVSKYARIGRGTIVLHHAVINTNAIIGENCIINTGAIIEHDCFIGNHCHISTGSLINGECTIKNNTFIGSNSVLLNGTTIGESIVLGAGSTVVDSINKSGIYAGNPLKRIGE